MSELSLVVIEVIEYEGFECDKKMLMVRISRNGDVGKGGGGSKSFPIPITKHQIDEIIKGAIMFAEDQGYLTQA